MKRVSGTNEPIVGVPVVLEPVEVQLPPLAVPVEIGHVEVAVAVAPKCAEYRLCHHPLNTLGIVSYSESEIP